MQDKLRRAKALYLNVQKDLEQYLQSATYIALTDAITLQEQVYNDTT